MMAVAVRFKRKERSKWEPGIGFSKDDDVADLDVIVDFDGKPVESVWKYSTHEFEGCMIVLMRRD